MAVRGHALREIAIKYNIKEGWAYVSLRQGKLEDIQFSITPRICLI